MFGREKGEIINATPQREGAIDREEREGIKKEEKNNRLKCLIQNK